MRLAYREEIYAPLRLTGAPLKWDVWATVKGGGRTGQALAIRHGVAQALQAFDIETYRPLLKRFKFLTFDSRYYAFTDSFLRLCLPLRFSFSLDLPLLPSFDVFVTTHLRFCTCVFACVRGSSILVCFLCVS